MNETKQENEGLPVLRLGDGEGVLRFSLLRQPALMVPPVDEKPSSGENFAGTAFRASGPESAGEQTAVAPVPGVTEAAGAGGSEARSKVWLIAGAVALVLAVALFFVMGGSQGSGGEAADTSLSRNFVVGEGQRVPEFRGTALTGDDSGAGEVFASDDLLGRATVLLSWSARDEGTVERLRRVARLGPALESASRRPIRVVSLNLDASADAARAALVEAEAGELFTLFDRHPSVEPADRVSARLRIVETPWLFLVDERGHLEDADLSLNELAALGREDAL
ncbi:MAG: hypothetical protein GVY36_14615 [Verrucomicrobia bacterium]|jgi:hypothetical protein|nr:hypothetical protein [Verrucomicrobiota bacterium]